MPSPADVLVIGSGSLARELCLALSVFALNGTERVDDVVGDDGGNHAEAVQGMSAAGLRVVVAARSPAPVDELVASCGARAALAGQAVSFSAARLDPADSAALDALLARCAPRVVVLAASPQSPWEFGAAATPWSELVARAGFGITLPLQAAFALGVGDALRRAGSPAAFVNACYPDAVNPLLHARGIAVSGGIGNVTTLAAFVQAELGCAAEAIRLVAHHRQLDVLHDPARARPDDPPPLCTVDGRPCDVGATVGTRLRAVSGARLNAVNGATAVPLLAALLSGRAYSTHLPGPLGLPGGYPVLVANGTMALRLPDGVSAEAAVARNQHAAEAEGVLVDRGRVIFSERARSALRPHLGTLADGFAAAEADDAAQAFARLRERLRRA